MSNAANTVTLNGQEFKLLPLNWKQLRDRRDDIITINGLNGAATMFSDEQCAAISRVVLASLSRSRNDLTAEFVEEWLDLGNVTQVLQMVFGVKTEPNPNTGEAPAAVSTS